MKSSVKINGSKAAVFDALMNEQLRYYRRFSPELKRLTPGVFIHTKLPTKLNRVPVPATLTVTTIESEQRYVQETTSADDCIVQSYTLSGEDGSVLLTYEEQHFFKKAIQKNSYGITGLFYKFVFNRQCKQRARYLETKIQKDSFRA